MHRRRILLEKVLLISFVVGIVISGLTATALFQCTDHVLEEVLGAVGVGGLALICISGGLALVLWLLKVVRIARPTVGVRASRLFWERDDPVPFPGDPVMVKIRFQRPAYRSAYMALNPQMSSTSLEGIRSIGRAEEVLQSIRPEEERESLGARKRWWKDMLSNPWRMAEVFSICMSIGGGGVLYALARGQGRGFVAEQKLLVLVWASMTLLSSIGVLFKISVARRIAALNALVIAGVVTVAAIARLWIPSQRWSFWSLALFAATLGYFASTLNAPQTRRMCHRWRKDLPESHE